MTTDKQWAHIQRKQMKLLKRSLQLIQDARRRALARGERDGLDPARLPR
jgi:hypothetical protein